MKNKKRNRYSLFSSLTTAIQNFHYSGEKPENIRNEQMEKEKGDNYSKKLFRKS